MFLFRKKSLFIIIVPLITLIILLAFLLASPLSVKEISPPNGSVDISASSSIIVAFGAKVKEDQVEIVISPYVEFQKEIKQNIIILNPKPSFTIATNYNIIIKDKEKNKAIFQSTFKTVSAQGAAEVVEEARKIQQERYPLVSFSPPDSALFYFVYDAPKELRVFLKGNQQQAKVEFFKWAESVNVDLSAHLINFVTPP